MSERALVEAIEGVIKQQDARAEEYEKAADKLGPAISKESLRARAAMCRTIASDLRIAVAHAARTYPLSDDYLGKALHTFEQVDARPGDRLGQTVAYILDHLKQQQRSQRDE